MNIFCLLKKYEIGKCIFEEKEINVFLKLGWFFPNGKEEKQDKNLNVKRKVAESLWEKNLEKGDFNKVNELKYQK